MPFRLLAALAASAALASAAPAAAGVRVLHRDELLGPARALQAGLRVTPPRRAPARFDLVGVHWRGSGAVWFRTRAAGGGWSAWRPARPEGEDLPDRASGEAGRRPGWTLGNPWWTGPADEIQYRLSGRVSRLRAWFLSSPAELGRRRAALAGTPAIVPRSAWGADESIVRAKPLVASTLQLALVHHTAGRAPSSPEESAAIVRAIQAYHVKANGWNDIGYNFLVDPFGQVFEGRGGGVDANVVGAHAEGFNTGSVGVAVLGTYEGGSVSPETAAALAGVIAWRLDLAHVDPISLVSKISAGNARFPEGVPVVLRAVSGHRDTGFTSCPGDALYADLGPIAQAVAAAGLPKLYEPASAGGVGGPIAFTARLSDARPWTVTVTDSAGTVVASGAGMGPAVSWTWDATAAPAGAYGYRIEAGPDVLPAAGTIGGSIALDVVKLEAAPAAISPNGDGVDEAAAVTFSLTAAAVVSASVVDAAGTVVAALATDQMMRAGPVSLSWAGNLPDGSSAPEGLYRVTVSARSKSRDVVKTADVVVDRSLGALALSAPALSPNGDGRLESVEIGFDLMRPAQVRVRILDVHGRSTARVFGGALEAGRQVVSWAGRKSRGRVKDGAYTIEVTAATELGSRRLAVPVAVDTTPPKVEILSARTRRGAMKLRLRLSEEARLKVWLDRTPFTIDRPAGPAAFWQRLAPRRVRVVAWDAAGNRGAPARLAL